MATTAIIQFIGIVLFSSAVPNDPGVHAILPRIDHATHLVYGNQPLNPGDAIRPPATDEAPAGVEDHVAVILFRKQDVLARAGTWKKTGELRSDWQFVELDGEQVQFLTNGANGVPEIPADLPRAASSPTECLVNAENPVGLKDDFHGPEYPGAAAVVDIPFGMLDVCAKKTADDPDSLLRVDTTLLMKTEGVLVIAARKTTETTARTITLDGDALVYVANVPPHYVFTGTYGATESDPHWQAYNEMLDTPCPSEPSSPRVAEACDLSAINEAWKTAQSEPPTPVLMMVDSECSNSQWP